ncbi:substrate-binding domain-containing protein [Roseibium sp.]|uniref:substrate-binding domain-containing protein n=1 Tax=Roseibium sp. TaxID=1936156 RepID=UPI003B52E86B
MKLVNTLNGYAFKITFIAGLAFFWLLATGNFTAHAQGSSLDEFWSLAEFTELNERQKQTSDNFAKRVSADAIKIDRALKPVKIAVIYPGKQASDYWRRSLSSFEARLAEIGLPYEIGSFFSGSSSYVGNQAQLITESLKNDPDYLVFTLDALRHKPIVQRLIARGRPKVILQNITTPLKAWRDRQPFLYVGFDHVTGTELLIDYYKKRLGTKKNFAILFGPRGYVSRARGNTFLQAYSDPDSMNLKASYYVGYDRQKSRDAAERILDENPNLDFIYACSTDIALGAIDAIESRNRQANVITNGWGGGSDELVAILKGELEVTVMRMNDDNGVAMAEAIVLDQSGKSAEIPIVFSGEFAVVSKENSEEDINELKARAFRYSK